MTLLVSSFSFLRKLTLVSSFSLIRSMKNISFLCLSYFLCFFMSSTIGYEMDRTNVLCLKSIKASVEDPLGSLDSWIFSNRNNPNFICSFRGINCWSDPDKIMDIQLSNMGLRGQFPRGIQKCTSLTGLDLSNNNFTGHIPSDIDEIIPYVTSLDLSFNKFSGKIPPSLANCPYLNFLRLENNHLTGLIPPELRQIKFISIANNSGLYWDSSNASEEHGDDSDNSFIFGFFVGWFISITGVIAIFWLSFMPKVQKNNMKLTMPMTTMLMARRQSKIQATIQTSTLPIIEILKDEQKQRAYFNSQIPLLEKLVKRMRFTELVTATFNFREENIIGLGKTGTMYKAVISCNSLIAVKRFNDLQPFQKQLETLGGLRHRNVVPLLGFCIERKERLLVYKYMSNGNLYDWLHRLQAMGMVMEWPRRATIGIGIAKGLSWLHYTSKFTISHGNISSKCILLDQSFEPKISHFKQAIIMKSHTFKYHHLNSLKNDVYSYGLVLLELVTGKIRQPNEVISNDSNIHIGNSLTTHRCDASSLYKMIDKSLVGRGFDCEIVEFLKVACDCLNSSPYERPRMLQVYKTLSDIRRKNSVADEDTNDEIIEEG